MTDKAGNIMTIAPAYFSSGSQILTSSGSFTVPAGVYQVYVVIVGGGGGWAVYNEYNDGGNGGEVMGIIDVTPGDVLAAVVGAAGTNTSSSNYGGGGGGSSLSRAGTLLAAAGGGGGGNNYANYTGYGGGLAFGTSINGSAATSANTAGGLGGNNYIGFLRNPVSYAGYSNYNDNSGYNISYPSNAGGYALNPSAYGYTAYIPYSSFEAKIGGSYGSGGFSYNAAGNQVNSQPGVVAIFY
jgi:hypothetical protein